MSGNYTARIVYGIEGKLVYEAATKARLDEDDMEILMDLIPSDYHGSAEKSSSEYFGIELGMVDFDVNTIDISKIAPQGMALVRHSAAFKEKVRELITELENKGCQGASKLRFPSPKVFLVIGTE